MKKTFSPTLSSVHAEWQPLIECALETIAIDDQKILMTEPYLPGEKNLFNAFSIPLSKTKYILFGESPYPRANSANGFAFWDAAVNHLWSANGLSKEVNRATSLRNFIKMLLLAKGSLCAENLTPAAIAQIDKTSLIQTLDELFQHMLDHGFLLLNASLTLSERGAKKDAMIWKPFMQSLLSQLQTIKPNVTLLLFGNIAKELHRFDSVSHFQQIVVEHPYNLSFIQNPKVIDFFKSFSLLSKEHAQMGSIN